MNGRETILDRAKQSILLLVYPVTGVVLFLVLWAAAIYFLKIPAYILPYPSHILEELVSNWGYLLEHSWVTAYEALVGFALALVIGFSVAVLIVWSTVIGRTILPLLIFLQAMPKVAVAPLFVIWFGFGALPKILVTVLICFFPIVINSAVGMTSVDNEMLDLIKSMSARKGQVFLKVRIPNSLPFFFTSLQISIVLALVGAIVGEFVGADAGLGYLIQVANANLQTRLLFSCIAILVLMGAVFFYVIAGCERLIMPWKPPGEEAGKTATTSSTC
jgi:NitT/TauT family transport system permease protein